MVKCVLQLKERPKHSNSRALAKRPQKPHSPWIRITTLTPRDTIDCWYLQENHHSRVVRNGFCNHPEYLALHVPCCSPMALHSVLSLGIGVGSASRGLSSLAAGRRRACCAHRRVVCSLWEYLTLQLGFRRFYSLPLHWPGFHLPGFELHPCPFLPRAIFFLLLGFGRNRRVEEAHCRTVYIQLRTTA